MDTSASGPDRYRQITRLEASIGGLFGASYSIGIDFSAQDIHWAGRFGPYGTDVSEADVLTRAELEAKMARDQIMWQQLPDDLRALRVLDWQDEYIDHSILDGTNWFVELTVNGETVSKRGINDYPPEWEAFCSLMERISGREFR